jgi:hypothetical protein
MEQIKFIRSARFVSALLLLFLSTPLLVHAAGAPPAAAAFGQAAYQAAQGTASPTNTTPTPTTITCPNGQPLQTINGKVQGCALGYTPLEPIPGFTSNTLDFQSLLNSVFKILFTVGALLAVLMLTIGGVEYMVAESVGKKAGALHRAQNALWGMLLLAASYLILNTINPQLLTFNLAPCALNDTCTETSQSTPPATPGGTSNGASNNNGDTTLASAVPTPPEDTTLASAISTLPEDTTYYSTSQIQSQLGSTPGVTAVSTDETTNGVAAISIPNAELLDASNGISGFDQNCTSNSGTVVTFNNGNQSIPSGPSVSVLSGNTGYACVSVASQ